ncbi:hypothetical protein EGW08_012541, partial [Elysia chlorotica]
NYLSPSWSVNCILHKKPKLTERSLGRFKTTRLIKDNSGENMSRNDRPDWSLDCKVYVGDLGHGCAKQELEERFAKYGQLRNVWVARKPPGFAFVEFHDRQDAEDAVRACDGAKINGRKVRVEMSSGRSRWGSSKGGSSRSSRGSRDDRDYYRGGSSNGGSSRRKHDRAASNSTPTAAGLAICSQQQQPCPNTTTTTNTSSITFFITSTTTTSIINFSRWSALPGIS